MNKILPIHFVRIIVGVGFVVGQTILILLRFAFSMNKTGITNLLAVR